VAGTVIKTLVDDLAAEAAELADVLDGLPDDAWHTPTPAVGWTVHDQVAHLAHFDWVTRLAISRPDEFVALRDSLGEGMTGLQTYVDGIGPANASRDGKDMLRWWREQGRALRDAVAAASASPSAGRVPWFGPSMSLASKVTARIMETWAHGQDVVDGLADQGLDVVRAPTDRLRHVARIGVLAMPNSFATHATPVPTDPVRVALTAPSGETWTWGPDDAADAVTGDALDFCLVVTQRRHVADTGLEVAGPAATAWIEVAQAFAGPPGAGRRAGQFVGAPR
jgi:uncharacterized protein (TIGR03084 family)